jgi:hypothetical protein
VIQRKTISLFLLCLLLLVNWHNAFFHAHYETEEAEFPIVHQHDHDHHHSHHHGQSELALWNWIKGLLGDFEHPDLGENHFELFLNPNHQIGLGQSSAIVFQPFIFTSLYLQLSDVDTCRNDQVPIRVLSFSDPPFFDSLSNRGPPAFS